MADEKLPRPETWAVLTKDQYLKYLGDLEDIDFEYYRQMFLSHMINLELNIGSINPDTSHLVPGIPSPAPGSEYTTTAVAALTLTCPANRRLRVYYAGACNNTQASVVNLTGTFGGNVVLRPLVVSLTNSQILMNVVIGKPSPAAGGTAGSIDEIWLAPGESITITCATFAAGNDTEHLILYEEYRA